MGLDWFCPFASGTGLNLFDNKPEWTMSEIVDELNMNVNTASKNVKSLVDKGYMLKNGGTKGAWYEKKTLD
jgi:DNA-binding IclR family transcriptional regulator